MLWPPKRSQDTKIRTILSVTFCVNFCYLSIPQVRNCGVRFRHIRKKYYTPKNLKYCLPCFEDIWEYVGRKAALIPGLDSRRNCGIGSTLPLGWSPFGTHCIGGRVWRWRRRETFHASFEVPTVVLLNIQFLWEVNLYRFLEASLTVYRLTRPKIPETQHSGKFQSSVEITVPISDTLPVENLSGLFCTEEVLGKYSEPEVMFRRVFFPQVTDWCWPHCRLFRIKFLCFPSLATRKRINRILRLCPLLRWSLLSQHLSGELFRMSEGVKQMTNFNPLALELHIYSLTHHLCNMWIFYEARRVKLGNARHFVEE